MPFEYTSTIMQLASSTTKRADLRVEVVAEREPYAGERVGLPEQPEVLA